jgi:Fe-S-cluster containining protein
VSELVAIRERVAERCEAIAREHGDWPCRKGCDECCRRLAAPPRVSEAEWREIAPRIGEEERRRIRESAGARRPVVCPLLDTGSGACVVYEARPVACRTYGLYVEREGVLGCSRIEAIAAEGRAVVWGNHAAVEGEVAGLGEARELAEWLEVG